MHTCLDTSGFLNANYSDEMIDDIDLCLLDVKSGDEETYKRVTGGVLQPTIDFGQMCIRDRSERSRKGFVTGSQAPFTFLNLAGRRLRVCPPPITDATDASCSFRHAMR